jgi:hypothetical protein
MSRDHYEEIASPLGHLVMAFNELEVAAAGAIMHILDQEERVGSVFVALNFSVKLKMLKSLEFKYEQHPRCNEFRQLVKDAEKINEGRNRFIHAEYWPVTEGDDTMTILMRRLRDASKPLSEKSMNETFKIIMPANPEEVMELANDAAYVAFGMLQLSEKFRSNPS